ncbi:MAG: PilZ domain-containing protein [Candidatus Omnitrophica bacterium]|nr:PilZ domain-containing protein [Candidatus Omnitrophota bacterium]
MDNLSARTCENRQHPRFLFKQAVKYQIGEYSSTDGSLSKDLSRGGMCLTVSQFVGVKDPVLIYLQQHGEANIIALKGVVAWIKMLADSELYQIGIKFDGSEEVIRREVNYIISDIKQS